MTWGLRSRLTVSYVMVALLCVLLVSALANGVLEASFRAYVRNSQLNEVRQVVAQVGAQIEANGAWDEAGLTTIGMNALEHGMVVKVADPGGRTIWDATVHNSGLCVQMITHMAQNMASRYPNWHGAYTESIYPARASFREVASVTVGTYGPFYLDDQELSFINSLNRLLLWIGGASLAFAVGIGLLMARRIAVPLAAVAVATQRIAGGERDVLITRKTGVRELDGIAAAVNDLSRSLQEQEALRRRLTSDVAHELRTPLATLQSHLEALIDGVWAPEQARLTGLHEEIMRINRLVTDLENLARFEGDAALRRSPTDLGELVRATVGNHQAQYGAKGVALAFSVEGDNRLVSIDPDRMSQAVINLLSNALKFTPAGGSVRVDVRYQGSATRVSVSDTGVGIEPRDLARIFERFYRVDSSRSRETGGSGIGLSIARAIVEAHGGTLTAASEPGRGSCFTIDLPSNEGASRSLSKGA
jgi:two-component system, OmpR family, sensor histidine kinase BaeS